MAGTQVTSPNQVTCYERKNIWQIIGFISVLILIFAYKLGIDSAWKIYTVLHMKTVTYTQLYMNLHPSYCDAISRQ